MKPSVPDAGFARRAFVTLLLILAAQSLTETARDTLFLMRLPLTQLPWMYAAVALASVLVTRGTAVLAASTGRSSLPLLLLGSALVSGAFWVASASRAPIFVYLLYIWPSVFASVVVVEFWKSVSDAYTITEAKSAFGRLGAGGTAGAAAGSALALSLSTRLPPTALLLVASVVIAGAALAARRLTTSSRRESPDMSVSAQPSPLWSASLVGSASYLRGVAACLFLATTAATLTDFIFKGVLTRDLPPGQLTTVIAATSCAVNVGALVLQLTLVGPSMRRLGVIRSMTVLPSALAFAATAVAGGAGLIGAIVVRITDGTFRYSLHRASADLLYVPLTPAARARIKSVIDVLSQRVGQVIASVGILAVLGLGGGYRALAIGIVLMNLAMVVIALRLTQPYLNLFRTMLRKAGTETRLALPSLDVDSLASLIGAFSSQDERAVIAAMDLVVEQGEAHVIPVVMLFHPSTAVVLRVLDLFEQQRREGFVWALDHLRRAATDPQVKAAALRAYARQSNDPAILWAARDDDSDIVSLTALVDLVAGGQIAGHAATRALAEATARASVAGLASLATAIRSRPSPIFEETLLRLAEHRDLQVRMRAVEAMRLMPRARFLPVLRTMLGESALRPLAREAFVALGRPALDFLAASLNDESLPRAVRLHVPRSISLFEASDAVPLLWSRLSRESDDLVRFKILRGVGHLVAEMPQARPSSAAIAATIQQVAHTGLRYATWRVALERAPHPSGRAETHAVLTGLLADRQHRALEAVFRLLKLGNPAEDFERIYRGLHGSRTERASGRELIESLVHGAERDIVLAMLDAAVDSSPPGPPATIDTVSDSSYEDLLEIVHDSQGILRSVALRHAAEIGLIPATR